jgi:hypothetical protein
MEICYSNSPSSRLINPARKYTIKNPQLDKIHATYTDFAAAL